MVTMTPTARAPAAPIAIVGIGAIFPGRGDTTGFWRDIFEGRDLLSPAPASHWLVEDYYDPDPRTPDKTYGRRGGFLSPVAFDPMAFGIPPNAMETTDTAQLLALIAARMTLEDAERDSGGRIDRSRTSVILGVASATELTAHMAGRLQRPTWVNAMRSMGLPETDVQAISDRIANHYTEWKESTFPGLLGNVVAGRIANRLDLGGSNYVTDAACASSLSALQIALHELRAGDSDMVLTGGVDALNDILMFLCFSKTPALSPTEDCRPFSANADGTMLGEGIGMLALRRLADAERDGNTIHAVIRGLGGASDGRGTAIYTPLPSGQARALRRAYEQAGYSPSTVELVEAHGTGTKAGDKAELEGLHDVFADDPRPDGPWCAIGSVKSQIGHTKAAAGSASLIKTIEALRRKVLPPTIKIDQPAAAIAESGVFYLNTEARPWIAVPGHPRRASVSSFGFGGSNFHVTLEEYTGAQAARPPRVFPAELFLYAEPTANDLADALEALAEKPCAEDAMAQLAGLTHEKFDPSAIARAALVASSPAELAEKAARLAGLVRSAQIGRAPLPQGCSCSLEPAEPGAVALLFSGQGSQYPGMGADLAMAFPAARAIWDAAAGHPETGPLKLHRRAFPPAAFDQVEFGRQVQDLTAMQHAQPAIAAVALSHLALLRIAGVEADMTGGHSFGEIMALHYGGAFDRDTALTVAAARGRCMAEAAQSAQGAMLAVQAGSEALRDIIDEIGQGLVLANDNGPSQTVLSGPAGAIEAAAAACQSRGLKASRLKVATAFHSEIVSPAVEPFKAVLAAQKIRKPRLPVYANASAAPYKAKTADLPVAIASQLACPVRFRELVEAMYAAGARIFIEAGPGNVVSGLVKDCLGDRDILVVALDSKRMNGVSQFLSALGSLSVAGVELDYAALLADTPPPQPRQEPSRHAIMISGANHGRPYPPAEGAAGRAAPNSGPREQPIPSSTAPPAQPNRNTSPMPNSSPLMESSTAMPPSPSSGRPAATLESVWHEVSLRHQDYLNQVSAAHTAYLNTAAAILGAAAHSPAAAASLPAVSTPLPAAASPAPARRQTPDAPPRPAGEPYTNGHAHPNGPAHQSPAVRPVQADRPEATSTPGPQGADASRLVQEIISEKTGYPSAMLDADMDLEGELGVDSIKQVEILSAIRDRLPHLPEIDPERLVDLRTIRAIAAMIESAGVTPATETAAPPASSPAPSANGHAGLSADTVRALIADKTGYPAAMLEDDMDLEGELGVDSIKQVEILSALRESHPGLPEVDPEQLAELRTIRKIADFFA